MVPSNRIGTLLLAEVVVLTVGLIVTNGTQSGGSTGFQLSTPVSLIVEEIFVGMSSRFVHVTKPGFSVVISITVGTIVEGVGEVTDIAVVVKGVGFSEDVVVVTVLVSIEGEGVAEEPSKLPGVVVGGGDFASVTVDIVRVSVVVLVGLGVVVLVGLGVVVALVVVLCDVDVVLGTSSVVVLVGDELGTRSVVGNEVVDDIVGFTFVVVVGISVVCKSFSMLSL